MVAIRIFRARGKRTPKTLLGDGSSISRGFSILRASSSPKDDDAERGHPLGDTIQTQTGNSIYRAQQQLIRGHAALLFSRAYAPKRAPIPVSWWRVLRTLGRREEEQ